MIYYNTIESIMKYVTIYTCYYIVYDYINVSKCYIYN